MRKNRFFNLIGVAGIDSSESARTKRWGSRFDIALLPVALIALLAWYANKRNIVFVNTQMHIFSDWLLWGFFVAELVTLCWLVKEPLRYLRNNWFNLVVIVAAMPLLWQAQELGALRAVRFILVGLKLATLSTTIRSVLSRNNLGLTILAVWVFVLFVGVIMATIEPSFNSVGDGVWWALVTVTTVGYGDVVPVTGTGRLLAGFVMLVGMGLFSLITANMSAFLVAREETKIMKKESQIISVEELILTHLKSIEERLNTIEKKLNQEST